MRVKIDKSDFFLVTEFIEQFLDNSKQFFSYNLDCIDRSEEEEEVFLELLDEKLLNADAIQQGKIHYLRGYLYCTTKYSYKDLDVGLAFFERAILLNDNHKVLSALGCLYKNGEIDGKPDYPKAIELFTKGIALNNSNAMHNLGIMYYWGQVDGQPNYLKAKELFEQAIVLNNHNAMNHLGSMHFCGQIDGQPNYLKAQEFYEQAIALNNSLAMYNLGAMYKNGQVDGQPNCPKAIELFEQAIVLNEPNAVNQLGLMYLNGEVDGQPNYFKAKELFEQASALNHSDAIYRLGIMYYLGQVDGQPNYFKAKELFEKASVLNHSGAIYNLGAMYKNGQVDGQPNCPKAIELFEQAIVLNEPNAVNQLGLMYLNGEVDGQPNYLKAKELFEQASTLNHSDAMFSLGIMYYLGQVDEQPNYQKAKELFEKASVLNHSGAMYNLGAMYLNGQVDGQPNYLKAKELFEQTSALNHSNAMFNLGIMYKNGQVDGQPNYQKAKELLEQASVLNHSDAMYVLGLMYYNGQVDGQPNYLKAKELFEQASVLNHSDAMFNLGMMYYLGQVDGQPNYQKAKELLEQASVLNHSDAMYVLGLMYYNGQVDGKPNDLKAKELVEKAIALNHGIAMILYAHRYLREDDGLKKVKLYRQAWALNSGQTEIKGMLKGLLEKIQEKAIDLPIKYHCTMALCPESIMNLFKENPRIVGECVLYDDLLTLGQKKELFNQSIQPVLEELSYDSLLAEYYLYFAKTDIVNQESYCFKAFEYYHQAKVNNASIALEITHELYYLMAKLYDELGDNYKDAIMLCVHIKDYIPAQHLLAHLLITHTCYLTQQHRHLLCFQALQHQTDLPSIRNTELLNILKKQYKTQWQAVKDKPEIEQLTWYLEQNQQALMHANTVLAGCVLVWQLADVNDLYDELEVEKQYKQLLPNLNDVPVLNLCLWKESLQNSMTNPDIQSEENTKRENHRSTLRSDLIQHLDKEISTYTHKWMLFFDSAKTPGIKEIVSKSIHAGVM